jgi:hypothetical protein
MTLKKIVFRPRFRARIRAMLEEYYIFLLCIAISFVLFSMIALVVVLTDVYRIVTATDLRVQQYNSRVENYRKDWRVDHERLEGVRERLGKLENEAAQCALYQRSMLARIAILEKKVPP